MERIKSMNMEETINECIIQTCEDPVVNVQYFGHTIQVPRNFGWVATDEDGGIYAYLCAPSFTKYEGTPSFWGGGRDSKYIGHFVNKNGDKTLPNNKMILDFEESLRQVVASDG